MVKSARISETETFGIVGRFHRFEDLKGKPVYVPVLNIQIKGKEKKKKENLHLGSKRAKGDRIDSKQTRTSLTNEISIDRYKVNEYKS